MMELAFPAILTVPFALGLLGFIEPCTIGAHLIFLRSVDNRAPAMKAVAIGTFIGVRALVMGGIGAVAALLGQQLFAAQSVMWLLFGFLYVGLGAAYAANRIAVLQHGFSILPSASRAANSSMVLGIGFGLSIPACAAPILVVLIGLAAGSGATFIGLTAMAVFALGLSVPLLVLAAIGVPAWLKLAPRTVRWMLAAVFVAVGLWSIWFGLFVDATTWTG